MDLPVEYLKKDIYEKKKNKYQKNKNMTDDNHFSNNLMMVKNIYYQKKMKIKILKKYIMRKIILFKT